MANNTTLGQAYHGTSQHGAADLFSSICGEFLMGSMNEIPRLERNDIAITESCLDTRRSGTASVCVEPQRS